MTLKKQLQKIFATGLATGKNAEFVATAILYWLNTRIANLNELGLLDDDQATGEEILINNSSIDAYKQFLKVCRLETKGMTS